MTQGLRRPSQETIVISRQPPQQPPIKPPNKQEDSRKPPPPPSKPGINSFVFENKNSENSENKKKTNYAGMALERQVQRSNSQKEINFEMVLRRGNSIEDIKKNIKRDEGFRISVGQKEVGSGFEKIMNDFYEQEHENRFVLSFFFIKLFFVLGLRKRLIFIKI